MITISLTMIVKNEEDVLKRCLNSVKDLVDEIVIVDTGSTDNTKQIAKQFTNKVYDFVWCNDFAMARNYALSFATCDYVMWLDADDVIPSFTQSKFSNLKKMLSKKKPNTLMMKYDIAFDENNNCTFSYYRERILKNNDGFIWQEPVHEVITPHGSIIYSKLSIEHRPTNKKNKTGRNLKIYKSLLKHGKKLSPRAQYYYSRELMFNGKYKTAIKNFEKLLRENKAWKENLISACQDLAYCYSKIGDNLKSKQSLIKSFCYDTPRADVCCKLADKFLQGNNVNEAIYWYKVALKDKINLKSGAFVIKEYYYSYPLLQLCFCYYLKGNLKKAVYYNNKVAKYNSKDSRYLYNKEFFDSLNNSDVS